MIIHKNTLRLLSLGLVIFCVSISCVQTVNVNSPGVKMNYPLAAYSGLAWISESKLAAFPADEDGGVTSYYLENDKTLYSLDLPPFVAELDCKGPDDINYAFPSQLPDGRLGLMNGCKSRSIKPDQKRQYMVAYDFQSKETQLLVSEPLPNYLSNGYTWNPEMTLGLQQIYGTLNGTIYWMSSDEIAPVDFSISDGTRSFLPAKDFPNFLSDSETQGIVFSPTWSPDGKTIAFFVTLDAIGRRGWSRYDGEYKIFFMDPIEQKPRPVVGEIYRPARLSWSPNSKWLAFIGDYGIFRTRGIWLYSIESGQIYPVISGDFSRMVWSPDGSKIAATICEPDHPDLLCDRYEIWEYDVSSIK